MQYGTGNMERIGMNNQQEKILEATLARSMEGVRPCRLYKHSSWFQFESVASGSESVIQFNSIHSLHAFIHTRAYNSYTQSIVNLISLLNILVSPKIRIHYSNLSPTEVKDQTRELPARTDITYTALCPYRRQSIRE